MTYEEIATHTQLDPRTRERFLRYMHFRWGGPIDEPNACASGYAAEWARFFRDHLEYSYADQFGKVILRIIDDTRRGHHAQESLHP